MGEGQSDETALLYDLPGTLGGLGDGLCVVFGQAAGSYPTSCSISGISRCRHEGGK